MKIRKILSYILVIALLLCATGCKKQTDSDPADNQTESVTDQDSTEETKQTEASEATEGTQMTEDTQTTTATSATDTTETNATESSCIHVLGTQWKVRVPASCTDEGSRYKTCTLCGDMVTEAIPVLDHTPGSWTPVKGKEATCKQEGLQYQACKQCEKVLIYINTAKLAHTPNAAGTMCTVCKADISGTGG